MVLEGLLSVEISLKSINLHQTDVINKWTHICTYLYMCMHTFCKHGVNCCSAFQLCCHIVHQDSVLDSCMLTGEGKTESGVSDLLPQRPVGRQRQRPHGGLQLLLRGGRAAAVAAGHRSDLDVELLGLLVVKVRVAGVEVVLLLLGAACNREAGQGQQGKESRAESLAKSQSLQTCLEAFRLPSML